MGWRPHATRGSAIRGSLAGDDAVADWTGTGALLPDAADVGASGGWGRQRLSLQHLRQRQRTGVDGLTAWEVLGAGAVRLVGDELALAAADASADGVGDDVAVGVDEGSGDDVAVGVAEGSGEDVAVGVPDGSGVGVAVGSADGEGAADEADGEGLVAGELSAGRMRATVEAVIAGPGWTPEYAPASLPDKVAEAATPAPDDNAMAAAAPAVMALRTVMAIRCALRAPRSAPSPSSAGSADRAPAAERGQARRRCRQQPASVLHASTTQDIQCLVSKETCHIVRDQVNQPHIGRHRSSLPYSEAPMRLRSPG